MAFIHQYLFGWLANATGRALLYSRGSAAWVYRKTQSPKSYHCQPDVFAEVDPDIAGAYYRTVHVWIIHGIASESAVGQKADPVYILSDSWLISD